MRQVECNRLNYELENASPVAEITVSVISVVFMDVDPQYIKRSHAL